MSDPGTNPASSQVSALDGLNADESMFNDSGFNDGGDINIDIPDEGGEGD